MRIRFFLPQGFNPFLRPGLASLKVNFLYLRKQSNTAMRFRKSLIWFERIMVPLTAIALFFHGRIAYFDTISLILVMIMSMFYLVLNRKLYGDLSQKLTVTAWLLGWLHSFVFIAAIFCANAYPGAEILLIVNMALNLPVLVVLLIFLYFAKEDNRQLNKTLKVMLLRTFVIFELFKFPCFVS